MNFRSDILSHVMYRMGLLAVLRSKAKKGKSDRSINSNIKALRDNKIDKIVLICL